MAKLMSEAYYTQDASFGTFSWAAPEVLLGEKCSEKVDCYSVCPRLSGTRQEGQSSILSLPL
jgi:hypothetical protein